MRKVILIMLLAVVSNSVMAEWVVVDTSSDGTTTIYANPATIRKNGNMVKMWTLMDYKTARRLDAKLYMSDMSQEEYDCKEEQSRDIDISLYSGNMGVGNLVSSGSTSGWRPVAPGTMDEAVWKFVCGKK